jgi:hypothetical protein
MNTKIPTREQKQNGMINGYAIGIDIGSDPEALNSETEAGFNPVPNRKVFMYRHPRIEDAVPNPATR